MKLRLVWLLAAVGLMVAGPAMARPATSCVDTPRLTGINLNGPEFNDAALPGRINWDYVYPSRSEFEYFADRGANLIRLAFRWERVQHVIGGGFDPEEIARLDSMVDAARDLGMCILLDVHNYGAYYHKPIGSPGVPEEAFVDLWLRLAERYDDEHHVALGLMNEPVLMKIGDWGRLAQRTVTALREAGSKHLIMVAGGGWSGLHEWFNVYDGHSSATALVGLEDPLDRSVLEVHQYTDYDSSGSTGECRPPEQFDRMFNRISDWAREHGHKLFLGEFGVGQSEQCYRTLDRLLELMVDPEVWTGWAYFTAGPWWGDYHFNISPRDGQDAPQMKQLQRHFWNLSVPQAPVLIKVE